MKTSTRHWRNRRGDNYYYYENDKYGLGHVIAREGLYYATGKDTSREFKKLREAKAFVEKSWRRRKR
jgi:hypothetical protein